MIKRKKLIVSVLVIMILAITSFTFAYWAGNISGSETEVDGTVELGTGKDVLTSVSVSSQTGKTLVPTGRVEDSNESDAVEEVVLTYAVKWLEDGTAADETPGQIAVTITNIAIGGNLDIGAEYANVTITSGDGSEILLNGDTVNVVITITLDEPTRLDYINVAGKDITFDVNFAISVK